MEDKYLTLVAFGFLLELFGPLGRRQELGQEGFFIPGAKVLGTPDVASLELVAVPGVYDAVGGQPIAVLAQYYVGHGVAVDVLQVSILPAAAHRGQGQPTAGVPSEVRLDVGKAASLHDLGRLRRVQHGLGADQWRRRTWPVLLRPAPLRRLLAIAGRLRGPGSGLREVGRRLVPARATRVHRPLEAAIP